MKKIVIGSFIVIVFGIGSFFLIKHNGNVLPYKVEKIMRGEIVSSVTATGTVNAVTTVLVGTQVSGTIKTLYVDFNSPVKKNQLIAQIDPATFEAQVEQAKANLFSAKANLDKSEATVIDAKRTMERNRELVSENLIAQSDFDTAETNYETAKASVSAAKAQIAQTEAALKFAETNLQYSKILSPVDGVVISRSVDVGQTVAASFQTPTLFTIAQDLTKMQIDTNVDEADIGKINVGQNVDFTVDAYPEITFKGTVWQIRNAPIIVQNVVTYDVVIKVENPELKLKPGMTANVSIITSFKKDILKIPNAALRFMPSEEEKITIDKKGTGIWIIQKGKPKRIPIVTGISDGNYTEVTSGAVKESQEVIIESLNNKKEQPAPHGPRFF
ncbi:MAG: efflux RND transporter periplasmic adaptor subunit [Thermodesulfobacteriota bacterium]|jgi:HlyD family secretion protein|nr:MAG: efflux RND transporter periplasmic adaptor subunit [Thermodesulfobacteriota bacterium]